MMVSRLTGDSGKSSSIVIRSWSGRGSIPTATLRIEVKPRWVNTVEAKGETRRSAQRIHPAPSRYRNKPVVEAASRSRNSQKRASAASEAAAGTACPAVRNTPAIDAPWLLTSRSRSTNAISISAPGRWRDTALSS